MERKVHEEQMEIHNQREWIIHNLFSLVIIIIVPTNNHMFKIRLKLKLKLEYHTKLSLSLDDHSFKGQIVFYYSKEI